MFQSVGQLSVSVGCNATPFSFVKITKGFLIFLMIKMKHVSCRIFDFNVDEYVKFEKCRLKITNIYTHFQKLNNFKHAC